jgi:putative flippase GtrA
VKQLIRQIVNFGIVGIICFFIDYGIMILLTEICKIPYLISSGISFLVSVIINYRLSMSFVFCTKKNVGAGIEFTGFVILSMIGLALTEFFMWLLSSKIGIIYKISKILVTAIVMGYNFITRKIFLESVNIRKGKKIR